MSSFLERGRDKLGANRDPIGADSNTLRSKEIGHHLMSYAKQMREKLAMEGDLREPL